MPSMICARCGQPIRSSYVTALGKTWHPEHFTCAGCGKSLAHEQFIEKDGRPYCRADFQRLFGLKCSICGAYIDGAYVRNYWNDILCEQHLQELPSCFNCERPICTALTNGGIDLGDGRFCCNLCKPKVIGEAEINRRVLPRLVAFFRNYGLPLTSLIQGVPVRVVNLREMGRFAEGDTLHPTTGLIRKVVITGTSPTKTGNMGANIMNRNPSKQIQEILLLSGLTEINTTAVLAHEIGHAYIFAHDFPELPPVVEEGMAEIFSFLWMRSRKGPEVEFYLYRMEHNESPIYGEGFKRARTFMADKGFFVLLNYVRTHSRFPS